MMLDARGPNVREAEGTKRKPEVKDVLRKGVALLETVRPDPERGQRYTKVADVRQIEYMKVAYEEIPERTVRQLPRMLRN